MISGGNYFFLIFCLIFLVISCHFVPDDFHNETGAVPVPRSFAEDLLKRCAAVPYGMRCVDCNTDFSSSTQWKHHLDEFSDSHVCIASASSTMVRFHFSMLHLTPWLC